MTGTEEGGLRRRAAHRRVDVRRAVAVGVAAPGQPTSLQTGNHRLRRADQLKLARTRVRLSVNLHRVAAEEEAAAVADDHRQFAEEDEEEDDSRSRLDVAEQGAAGEDSHCLRHETGNAGEEGGGAARLPELRLNVLRLVVDVAPEAEEAEGVGEEAAHHQRIGDDPLEGAQASCDKI